MFQLDFTLKTDIERKNYVAQFDLSTLTPTQLELCANYILYGVDPSTNKTLVKDKYIYINSKYDTYKVSRPESLNTLLEGNPNIIPSKTHYKTVKPTIDRERDADIPTIKEMWENIDQLQYLLDCNSGKINDPLVKKLTPYQVYKLKHILVDIRRGQYYLKDIFKPVIGRYINKLNYVPYADNEDKPWNDPNSDYGFAPLGLIGKDGPTREVFMCPAALDYVADLYNHKAKHIVDFRNPQHIYILLDRYEDLACEMREGDTNLIGAIIETLEYYIGRANLKEQHYMIIEMKRRKIKNRDIARAVNEKFGLHHTENYISTIWTQKICVEIANAARLHYDEFLARGDDHAWKRCNTCGRVQLRDKRNFVRRRGALDELSGRCKQCDRAVRKERKEAQK